jgi:hypothetical protein
MEALMTKKEKAVKLNERPQSILDKLIKEEKPVYVYNRSKPKGDIAIVMHGPDNSPLLVVIPKTWIPISLTDQVPHSVLKGSIDLRRFISNKMLVLLDYEKAEEILAGEDGAEELARLNNSKYSSWEEAAASVPASEMSEMDVLLNEAKSLDNVHIGLKELLGRDISEEEKYHMLRSNEENYDKGELEFISVTTDSTKIKDWALKTMAKVPA